MRLRYLLCSVLLATALQVPAQKTLTILHTNDSHSCILPLSEQLADTMTAGRGGFLRRIALLKEERQKDPNLLLFDSGDFSQGSPYYTLFKGDVEIGQMNCMHYDAGTIGNHEFDFVLDNMARIFKEANFPIVCSNYGFDGTPLQGIVKPYTIIRRKGVRIGVLALCPKLDGLVDHKNYGSVEYQNPSEAANKWAAFLKQQKHCDLVICISHLGWTNEVDADPYVIARSRNIDLVLGEHSHTYFRKLHYAKNLDGKEIPVDQNGKSGIFIGKMVLTLDKAA
jgi:5'-nucleotidase